MKTNTYKFPSEYSAALFMYFCKGVDEGRNDSVEYKLSKSNGKFIVQVGE